ncbi:unnamed protein product [Owenia fusiformis]|uniref:Uncharacterized protein n=1 Tax=Owenia fusiformis TaxID=6347 RepID=A0A8J1YDI6_OWEFU|nr:unnamed protein product [Owenia fusiformis]
MRFCSKITRKMGAIYIPSAITIWVIVISSLVQFVTVIADVHCHMESYFSSPFVTAQYQQVTMTTGCRSRDVTSTSQQVYVLQLISGGPSHGHHGAQVSLSIAPIKSGIHSDTLIFVLSSQRRTTWRISSKHLNSTVKHIFIVNHDSRVRKVGRINLTVVKPLDIAPGSTELLKWVRLRYDAVTGFSEIKQANHIQQSVGIEPDAPATCVLSNEPSSMTQSRYIQSQDIKGCADPMATGDLHIIEVASTHTNPLKMSQNDITVNLDSSRGERHLVLVLKSQHGVQWVLRSRNFKGSIIILSNNNVDHSALHNVEIQMRTMVQVHSGRNLIRWIEEQYTTMRSYSSISVANHIDLDLGELPVVEEAHDVPKNPILPMDSFLTMVNKDRSRPGSHVSPFDSVSKTQVAIQQAINIQCDKSHLVVSLRKPILQMIGMDAGHLSLSDTSCIARSNMTHFILESPFTGCGTKRREDADGVAYANSIKVLPIDDEYSGSHGNPPDHSGMGMMFSDDANTHLDDEDFQVGETIKVAFECLFKSDTADERKTIEQPKHHIHPKFGPKLRDTLGYSLEVFTDNFNSPEKNFPILLQEKEKINIEASINADKRLHVVVDTCWLSTDPLDTSKEHKDHTPPLIQSGCKLEERTEWEEGNNIAKKRFSFLFSNYLHNDEKTYLHCELGVCSSDRDYAAQLFKTCVAPDTYCLFKKNGINGYGNTANGHMKIVHLGPFMTETARIKSLPPVIETKPIQHANTDDSKIPNRSYAKNDATSQINTDITEKCQSVIINGVDTPTVIGISVAAFIIGVLLTAALWLIHTHTGPGKIQQRRNRVPRRILRTPEGSSESTPNSTTPMQT